MSQDPSPTSAAPEASAAPGSHQHAADALGAISDFEKSIQGLKKLYEERREIEAKLVDAQSRLIEKETELARRDQELEQARSAQAESEKTVQLLRSESEASEAARRDSESALQSALSEVEDRKAKIDAQVAQQAAEAEKAQTLAKELDAFAADLHRLQSDLEKEKADLEATRTSLLDNAKALKDQESELESRKQAAETDLARRIAELDARAGEISAAHDAAGKINEADAELARRLAAETEACEQLRLDVDEIARRCAAQEEVLSEYEQLLAVERTRVHELVSEIHSSGAEPAQTKARIDELKVCLSHERQERERLHRTLTELQNAAKSVKQPREAGSHATTELRRRRLKRCRAILREHASKVRKASEILAKRFEQCEQVLSQRASLAAAKRQLDVASASMARRAASKRAGVLTLCCVFTLALLSALSWAVVGQAWPGDFAARTEIAADGRGRELSDPELDEWRRSLEATLADPQFVETVAGRMKQRGYESLGTPGAVRTLLTKSFSHDSPAPGVFALEIRAPGSEKAARTLDVLTTALASDANAARERRADGAVTLIKSPAVAGTKPVNDERLERAGIVMLCSVLLTCGLGFGIWNRLSRAKQEFELGSQIDQVLDDAKWSEFTAATTVSRPGQRQ
ncbi:MAG: hypothetical protein KF805_10405 [Phycisphaeraceae bacterium]|nr:hypothetical protein [Phycisphaeraceae bacterium]